MSTTIFEHNNSTLQVNVNHRFKSKDSVLETTFGSVYFLENEVFKTTEQLTSFMPLLDKLCLEFGVKIDETIVERTVENTIASLEETKKLSFLLIYRSDDGLIVCPPFLSIHVLPDTKLVGLHVYVLEEGHTSEKDLFVRKTTSNEIYKHELFIEEGFYDVQVFENEELKIQKNEIFSIRDLNHFLQNKLGSNIYSVYKENLEEKPF